uniref:Pycsar effector protein domain-containing protein n=1 Tax=Candidatus Kentrum sp. MB TaxID=2138164 RepID=A0A451BFU0_9GAMM|nr:MAG: hypothetical protein BECKMB1821G_GA0114241_11002 [Candidatus Kentron sp. MB]VFK35024.1 MAG: hypothetical protein BECKMB1821I_GA0114274_10962 [Candidatus Kentron sp. MB]VFK77117.1 MAG: hypothetical protein BECKMB1821H_GA0114242_11012 [Candidatus Kentron sp. MB]
MDTETRQFLENTLDRTIDMVKYAEAKHAILMGFAGASIFGFSKLFLPGIDTVNILYIYYFAFVAFSGLAIVISLFSFVPVFGNTINENRNNQDHSVNPVYFGDAARCVPGSYMKVLEDALKNGAKPSANYLIAEEIVMNSKIAMRKFRMFNLALMCFLSAILTPVISLILWGVVRTRTRRVVGY